MCLGVPGRITRVEEEVAGLRMGTVSFGGIGRSVCLAYVPEAQVDDYVVVHVGFAISRISAAEAEEVFRTLRAMERLDEPGPSEDEAGGMA